MSRFGDNHHEQHNENFTDHNINAPNNEPDNDNIEVASKQVRSFNEEERFLRINHLMQIASPHHHHHLIVCL